MDIIGLLCVGSSERYLFNCLEYGVIHKFPIVSINVSIVCSIVLNQILVKSWILSSICEAVRAALAMKVCGF